MTPIDQARLSNRTKLDPQIKIEWLAELALLEQGTGALRTVDDTYCCLGGLCNVAARHGVGQWEVPATDGGSRYCFSGPNLDGSSAALLGFAVTQWSGLEEYGAWFSMQELRSVLTTQELEQVGVDWPTSQDEGVGYNSPMALTTLNDAGVGFRTIARLIHKYL